jgi:hypothetical protein
MNDSLKLLKYFRHFVLMILLIFAILPNAISNVAEKNPGQPEPRLSGEVAKLNAETIGSRFYYDFWLPGKVFLESGAAIEDHLLMYNGFADELYYQHPQTYETIIADKKLISGFVLEGYGRYDAFKKISRGEWSGISGNGTYLRIIHEGNISLLVQQSVKRTGEVIEFTNDGIRIKVRLESAPIYHLMLSNSKSFVVKRFNRKTFFRILPNYQEEIRQAFRISKSHPKSDEERAELIKNINAKIYNK